MNEVRKPSNAGEQNRNHPKLAYLELATPNEPAATFVEVAALCQNYVTNARQKALSSDLLVLIGVIAISLGIYCII
jgi:hypothetical protein